MCGLLFVQNNPFVLRAHQVTVHVTHRSFSPYLALTLPYPTYPHLTYPLHAVPTTLPPLKFEYTVDRSYIFERSGVLCIISDMSEG